MSENLDERLAAGAARLEQEAAVRSPADVRARGDQRRRRHTATMAVVPVAVLAIAGTAGLTLRPSGGASRPNMGGSPTVSDVRTSAAGATPTKTSAPVPAPTQAPTRALAASVDLARHTLTVLDAQGKKIKTLGISAGSPQHPTPTGTFTVVDKKPSEKVTAPIGPDNYSLIVYSYIDLGPNAPGIYASPWDQPHFGKDNATRGEIALSPDDATWLYGRLAVGDTIQVGDAAG
ncbi:lipoprotein-anchoring transpeptidase ErfK/SrfK [Catenulispora sp. GP43]|uniref:L,D-transpeptidase family protein n=1 Tax=Catenulispora sp. GP43 TaxID=3156263 RepID=UPI0035193956